MWLGRLLLSSPIGFARTIRCRGPADRRHLQTWIDALGCPACGGRKFLCNPVINNELANAWRLNRRERAWFDEREGQLCASCLMSKRVRSLVWVLRSLDLNLREMDVLHVNQINNLSPLLTIARSLCETGFDPQKEPGADLGGLINQDLCHLTFPDRTFDLVIHSETLEHVSHYRRALAEVTRVLRPGGFQIYTVPILHHRRSLQRIRYLEDGTTEHLQTPSYHGLEREDLVVWEFGGSFIRDRERSIHRIYYDDFLANPTVFTIVERVTSTAGTLQHDESLTEADRPPSMFTLGSQGERYHGGDHRGSETPQDDCACFSIFDDAARGPVSTEVDSPETPLREAISPVQRDSWQSRSHQVRSLRREILKQTEAYRALESGYHEIHAHAEFLEREFHRLETYSTGLESTIAALRKETVARTNHQKEHLELQFQELQIEYSRLETAYREIREYVGRLESQLLSRNSEFSDLVDFYLEAKEYVKHLEDEIKKTNSDIPESDTD